MFTPPSVNQIASAYKGNPAPLNAKVDTDRKQNGGIPRDLRQLMAAYDLSQGRQNMGIQQALQIPTNMPTVAQDVQERARQTLQARQMQAMQEMQRKNGQPNTVPMGTPRPPMQAQGLDMLESNVGEGYAHGGIIGFSNGGNMPSSGELSGFSGPTPEQEARDEIRAAEQERAKQLAALEQKVAFLRSADAPQAQEAQMQLDALKAGMRPKPSPTDPNFRRQTDPRMSGTPAVSSSTPLVTSGTRPSAEKVNVSADKDSAPMPAGLKDLAGIPSTSAAYKKLTEMMNQDPEVKAKALQDRYMKEVGSRDLSIYDQMSEQLKARKERLNAPKAGYDATMELLEQIAASGGRNWMEAGSKGVAGQRALQKSRLSEQDLLMEKILDLGAKKSEAQFAEKKGMFEMTQRERDEIFKKAFDAAKSVNSSDDEAKRIAAQAVENEKNRLSNVRVAQIGAQDRDQLMNRAKALMAVDKTLTLEQAMTKASLAANASSVLSTESRDKSKGMEELRKLNTDIPVALRTGNSTFAKDNRRQYETTLAALEAKYGPLTSGINTLPSAGGPTSSNVRSQADAIIAGGR
jgi:hypothetical protein